MGKVLPDKAVRFFSFHNKILEERDWTIVFAALDTEYAIKIPLLFITH